MPREEKLPQAVQDKISDSIELLAQLRKFVPSYSYPLDAAIYVAAQLAGLDPKTVYSDYYNEAEDADPDTLGKLIQGCIGVMSVLDGSGLT